MKKIIFSVLAMTFLAIGGLIVSSNSNGYSRNLLQFTELEALASSEKGCVSRTKENNGHCTTDGTLYFCENCGIFDSTDCVKGLYF